MSRIQLGPLFDRGLFSTITPRVPTIQVQLRTLFIRDVGTGVFLVFGDLWWPTRAVQRHKLLQRNTIFGRHTITNVIGARGSVRLIGLTANTLSGMSVSNVRQMRLARCSAGNFLLSKGFGPRGAIRHLRLLHTKTFGFNVRWLTWVPFNRATNVDCLL